MFDRGGGSDAPDLDSRAETPNCGITTALPFQPRAGRRPLEKQGITVTVIKDVGTRQGKESGAVTCRTAPHFGATVALCATP